MEEPAINKDGTTELPAPREITRSALADPNFDVQRFLNDHSQFQTLRDTRTQVKTWETKLYNELLDVVNENYNEIIGAADSLDRGMAQLASVRAATQHYHDVTQKTQQKLHDYSHQIGNELAVQSELAQTEARARQLLRMFDLMDDMDALLPRVGLEQDLELRVHDLELLARFYTSFSALAIMFSSYKPVATLRRRADSARKQLVSEFAAVWPLLQDTSIDPSTKLRLLTARKYVLESKFP